MTPTIYTAEQIEDFLTSIGVQPPQRLIHDYRYVLPSRNWIFNEFARSLKGFYEQLGVAKWLEEKNDCDNGSLGAMWWARMLNARNPIAPNAELAFGQFIYWRESSKTNHALDCAIVRDSEAQGTEIVFFEWQTMAESKLTPKEIKSCGAYNL